MAQASKTVRATVARGRTVIAAHPTRRTQVVSADGKLIDAPHMGEYGPGAEVHLPAEEVAELQARGFLVNPDTPEPLTEHGPTFGGDENQARRIEATE